MRTAMPGVGDRPLVGTASGRDLQRKAEDAHSADKDKKDEGEEKEKQKAGDTTVQTKPLSGSQPAAPPASAGIQAAHGPGQPLPAGTRSFFEQRFGRDLGDVRVHAGADAASAADALRAQAFTRGRDVFFGAGRWQPGSPHGQRLLAHELTHTLQQRPAGSIARQAVTGAPATPALAPEPVPAPPITTPTTAPGAPAPPATPALPGVPAEEVALAGTPTFSPPASVVSYLDERAQAGGDVRVRLGGIAAGVIRVRAHDGKYESRPDGRFQPIPLTHPALAPLQSAGVQPVLALRVRDSTVEGYASVRIGDRVVPNPSALLDQIEKYSAALGWVGLSALRFPRPVNKLEAGVLTLQVPEFGFRLGGFLNGKGSFGLANEQVTFDATATTQLRGLGTITVPISRGPDGLLKGSADVAVTLSKFSGNLLAVYAGGIVDVKGTVRYTSEKLSGEVTLLVTDEATARDVARGRLGPDALLPAAPTAGPTAAPAAAEGPRPGPRALAGWGALDFRFTDWLTGKAQVIVDSAGHVTVVGEIVPEARKELFPQRDIIKPLPKIEVRALYGVPLVGNLFVFANVGLEALAKFGPGTLYNIRILGTYSTDPQVLENFSIAGTLNISAFAGLRLRAEGGAGIELLEHDIKAGVGINALAGVRGYVEATPTVGYRETADPQAGKKGEFFIKGHMELAAQPFLGLDGDLFVDLDSPWWSPAPDKRWTWPLGQLEYPLPGQFGIGADVDYVIGSDKFPEIQFTQVDFSADRFMTDLLEDHVPPKSKGEQDPAGQWQEGAPPAGAADPKLAPTQGAPPQQAATGQQQPGQGEVPKPDVQQRWLAGLRALSALVQRSHQDKFDQAAITAALAQLRVDHGFQDLRAERVGAVWRIHARMNPDTEDNPPLVEAEGPGGETVAASPAPAPATVKEKDDIEVISGTAWYPAVVTKVEAASFQYRATPLKKAAEYTGLARPEDYGTRWRRVIPGRSFKRGKAWETIRDDGPAWSTPADAKQVLNWRRHDSWDTPKDYNWHHIHEFSSGGPNSDTNLMLITEKLNADLNIYYGRPRQKGMLSLREWLRAQGSDTLHETEGRKALEAFGTKVVPKRSEKGYWQEGEPPG